MFTGYLDILFCKGSLYIFFYFSFELFLTDLSVSFFSLMLQNHFKKLKA